MTDVVLYEVEDRIATVTLNPPRAPQRDQPGAGRGADRRAAARRGGPGRALRDRAGRRPRLLRRRRHQARRVLGPAARLHADRGPQPPRGAVPALDADLGPQDPGDRQGARLLPRARHAAGGDLRHHLRRRGHDHRRAAAAAGGGLELGVLGVASRPEEGEGDLPPGRRHDHGRGGGGAGHLQRRPAGGTNSTPTCASTR